MTESAPQRASDVDSPEGGGPSRDLEGTGRTPHSEQPAEGPDTADREQAAADGVDPGNRISGV